MRQADRQSMKYSVEKPESESISNESQNKYIPICDKYALTIREAAAYFNIGIKKMRRLAEDNLGRFSFENGNRYLIIRAEFERHLELPV